MQPDDGDLEVRVGRFDQLEALVAHRQEDHRVDFAQRGTERLVVGDLRHRMGGPRIGGWLPVEDVDVVPWREQRQHQARHVARAANHQ